MKLSDAERRWLTRWEKRERQWLPFTRWLCLTNGILFAGCGTYFLYAAGEPYMEFLVFVSLFFFLKAGIWLGITFSNWRGQIKLRLLLRLVRDHVDETS